MEGVLSPKTHCDYATSSRVHSYDIIAALVQKGNKLNMYQKSDISTKLLKILNKVQFKREQPNFYLQRAVTIL